MVLSGKDPSVSGREGRSTPGIWTKPARTWKLQRKGMGMACRWRKGGKPGLCDPHPVSKCGAGYGAAPMSTDYAILRVMGNMT